MLCSSGRGRRCRPYDVRIVALDIRGAFALVRARRIGSRRDVQVAVVTDTTQYLPREVIERHGIQLVSLYVNWNGPHRSRDRPARLRRASTTSCAAAGELPSTSQPSRRRLPRRLRAADRARRRASSRSTSRAASPAPSSRRAGARAAIERGMAARQRMVVLDSRTGCAGHGFMSVAAANARRARRRPRRAPSPPRRRARGPADPGRWSTRSSTCARGGRIGAARGVDRRDAEGQADPDDRGRDAARRAGAHRGRAFERLVAHLEQRREDGCDALRRPAHPGAATRPSASPSAAARSSAATRSCSRRSAR